LESRIAATPTRSLVDKNVHRMVCTFALTKDSDMTNTILIYRVQLRAIFT
jgi:hypothetical protein